MTETKLQSGLNLSNATCLIVNNAPKMANHVLNVLIKNLTCMHLLKVNAFAKPKITFKSMNKLVIVNVQKTTISQP